MTKFFIDEDEDIWVQEDGADVPYCPLTQYKTDPTEHDLHELVRHADRAYFDGVVGPKASKPSKSSPKPSKPSTSDGTASFSLGGTAVTINVNDPDPEMVGILTGTTSKWMQEQASGRIRRGSF